NCLARLDALAGGCEAEPVQAAEGIEIRGREGSVGHVEVFQMASVRTSIIGRPRRLSPHRRAHPATDHYTLICEEPDLCQSTSTLPTNKYTVKAEDVVRVLRGGGATEGGVLEFVRACIANWVLAAPDAHAKNYSVFLGPAGVEALVPLYDVSTGLGYRDSNQ